jgi:hypothetical protein
MYRCFLTFISCTIAFSLPACSGSTITANTIFNGVTLDDKKICLSTCESRTGDSTKCSHCFRLAMGETDATYAPREIVVGTEYAGSGPSVKIEVSLKPRASGPPNWTCAAIAGRYLDEKAMLRGDLEVFRLELTASTKADAQQVFLDIALQIESFAKAHAKNMEDLIPEPKVAFAIDRKGQHYHKSSGNYHRCWYRDHVHPDVLSWPTATWPRTVQLAGLPGKVPAALAWSPQPAPRMNPAYCRQWFDDIKLFQPISTQGPRYDCSVTLTYRSLVQMSDGKELGSPTSIGRHERDLCGPETNARSDIEAALRHQAGPGIHIVDYVGECVKSQ